MAFYKRSALAIGIIIEILMASCAPSNGEGGCGRMPIRSAAVSLSPCLAATGSVIAKVPPACCAKVAALIKTAPTCLCAVLLSPLAKQAGIIPGNAITIPKRCRITNRPIGCKCGRYTVPRVR